MRRLAVAVVLVAACLLLSPQPAHDPGVRARSLEVPSYDGAVAAEPAPQPTPQAAPPAPESATEHLFGYGDVQRLAAQRAAHEFHPPPDALPPSLANLSFQQYRDISFRPESALWHGHAMFEVQFFHRGYRNRQRVNIFEVVPEAVAPVPYSPQLFVFGRSVKAPRAGEVKLGFAGFRVHYPLQTPDYKDEVIAFLGASYFRVLGRNERYGASARGLAIDTADPGGEEFPTFTDFWLVRPQPGDRALTVYALLDSKSVTGAYQFQIRPGGVTQVDVHCELYPRHAIAKLGVAPLTSMFLYSEDGTGKRFDDFRPEVHDSDGLMSETGQGHWIWRPLGNPRELRVNRFMDNNPRGFGLIQRERSFSRYQDAGAQYQLRPSYWVEPVGSWGKGGVELVEIPSDEEIHDNIVAYWVPASPVEAHKPIAFAYLLSAYLTAPDWPPAGRAISTRTGNPASDNAGHFPPDARRIVVEFAGGDLEGLAAAQPVKAEVRANNAAVGSPTVRRLADTGSWQVELIVTPKARKPVDLQCFLTLYGEVLTETWVYQWSP
ncbi:MAG TPA: glucan biosynthesis protein G [Steroidobacteraceae bacterium]|nr:glucan biosynthesis protein G [Steroidobacteraceae bacterium]